MMTEAPSGRCGRAIGDGVHHAEQVDVGGIDEVRRMGVTQRHRQNPGVGHDDVEASKIPDAGLERVAQFRALPHVGLAGDDASIELLDRSLGLGQVLGRAQRVVVRVDLRADVDGDDVRALLGHPNGMRSALSACRSGDEGDLALQASSHVSSLFSVVYVSFKSCGSRPCPSSGSAGG